MRPTTLSLQNYGGGEVNLVREMEVTIRRANFTINATIQVQAGAPVDLLLGTDVQPRLGFIFLASDADGSAEELLQGGKWTCDPKSKVKLIAAPATPPPAPEQTKSLDPTNTPVVVNLLQATRLPAQFSKTVRAKVTTRSQTAAIFEPEPGFLTDNNLQMANAVVIPDGGQQVTLIIENHGLTPLKLKKNQVLGHILPADPVDVTEVLHRDESGTPDTPVIAAINRDGGCDSRADQLLDLVEMGEDNLSEEEQTRLKQFLTTNAGVFALDQSELETTDVVTHTVNTGDHSPIRQHPRRTPFALRNQVTEMVKDMLDHQVIQPSSSPWASPIVLVEKKDGSLRFCVDYRRLNSITKMDVFPLPRIDDTLDLLAKSKFFTTLDLRSGYWQVQMEKTSREKTAFVTHSGLYEFLVMPFGLCNAPATFQRLMETVLAGLVGECCLVYLDDILVIGETFEEHLGNLQKVFSRLKEANLRLHPKKCYFASPSVDYLGYHVSAEGLSTDARKTEAVANFSQPMDLKSLRSFLGLASYYRRFIPCFSKIASPLHLLTRKDAPFDWTPACDVAFCQLKQYLTSAPVLAFPLFDREFLLDTDASGLGLGAVLAQKQDDGLVRPIAFASRTLHPHEVNYGSTEMEALAVVWAVKHFRHYLYGHKCQVYTNHEALKSLQNTPHPSGKLARWGLALQEVDLTIHYRPGRVNKNADALSRQPLTDVVEEDNLFGIIANLRVGPDVSSRGGDSNLVDEQRGDPELAEIIQYLSNGVLPDDDKRARELALTKSQYSIVDRVLYHVAKDGTLRIVPPVASREKLCKEAHGGVYGAHLREAKLYGQLSKHYWWPRMRSDIENWCRGCLTCATRQPGRAVKPVLTPIPVSGPFDRVGVDVIHFPKSTSGNSYAVVFVDYLTKWPEVFATPDQTTLTIAKLLVEQIIPRHGVPKELLSDRGPAFLSKVMCDVYRLLGVHKLNTSAYHPRTDGLVERFNRTLTSMLAKTVEKGGKDWDFRLPFVLFAYRSSLQSSTRESPFYLLYGRDPQLPTDAVSDPPVVREVQDVDDYKSRISVYLADAWELAQANVQRAQKQQKLAYDRHARPQAFKPGDRVFVFMPRTKQNKAYKFARAFHGPYRVKEAFETGVVVLPVDRPNQEPIRVAIDRVRRCPRQIPDVFWPSKNKKEPEVEAESQPTCTPATHPSPAPPPETVWSGRLRSRPRTS